MSRSCTNCKATLRGAFCSRCGQKDSPLKPSFFRVLSSVFAEHLTFDSRMARTVVPFLCKPGFLTREYNAGRRMRYSAPLRLYLLMSLMLFMTANTLEFISTVTGRDTAMPRSLAEAEQLTEPVAGLTGGEPADSGMTIRAEVDDLPPWIDTETGIGRWLQQRIDHAQTLDDEELFTRLWHTVKQTMPTLLFLLLPVFAWLLRLAFIRTGTVYAELLVFSLHAHAFSYAVITVLLLMNHQTATLIGVALLLTYYLLALRCAFATSVWQTLLRGGLGLLCYLPVLGLGLGASFLFSMVTIE